MPLNLRPWQLLALPYLEWLLDDGARVSGRSTTIAVAMIRMAARNPGQRINFWDHIPGSKLGQNVRDIVLELIHEDLLLNQHYTSTTRSFQINLPVAVENWLPATDRISEALIDRFPPPKIIGPQTTLIGGRDLEGQILPLGVQRESFLEAIARNRHISPEDLAKDTQRDHIFWHDHFNAVRYALESFDPRRVVETPEEPGPSVLDRILADDSDF